MLQILTIELEHKFVNDLLEYNRSEDNKVFFTNEFGFLKEERKRDDDSIIKLAGATVRAEDIKRHQPRKLTKNEKVVYLG